MTKKTKIQTPTVSFVTHYPQAKEFANAQLKVLWFPDEVKIEKDIQDVLVNMTEAERHGVITTLRLFTLYELFAGKDYWTGYAMKRFPRPEIQRMCAVFGAFELGVHQPFYSRLNELLNLNTDDFYLSYVEDPVLKERMDFVESMIANKDDLLSTAVFSLVEGAILYSSFAFLKHFQSNGKNKLTNVVRGINFSAVDENFHAEGGAWLFRTAFEERKPQLTEEYIKELEDKIYEAGEKILEHERYVSKMIHSKGKIDGITETQLERFIESRLDACYKNLGLKPKYSVKYNPIADWFYNGMNNFQSIDFFVGMGREYQRDWDEDSFVWGKEVDE